MRSQFYTKIVFVLMLIGFVSIFFFARALISIGFIVTIIFFFLEKGPLEKLKQNNSLKLLFIAAIFINIGILYAALVGGNFDVKVLLGFSNPIFVILYICSASYFLSKNIKYADYLLNAYLFIVVIFSLFALFKFIYYKYDLGIDFVVSQIYFGINGGSVIQSIVALTFPFSAVIIIGKAIKKQSKTLKFLMIVIGLLIIFVDLFINRSKAGYIIEFAVFVYYSLIILKYFSYKHDRLVIKRLLVVFAFCLVVIAMIFGFVYKSSNIFHHRVNNTLQDSQVFFDKNYNDKSAKKQYLTSTGLRLLYYNSSLKVIREYPGLFILGCPGLTHDTDVRECTKILISKNKKLTADPRVVNDGIMAHDEFVNYVFRGGIIPGVCLFLFFIVLFAEAKWLDYSDRIYFRILIMTMFIGCLVDYFFTTQIMVILFINFMSIFLAKRKLSSEATSRVIN